MPATFDTMSFFLNEEIKQDWDPEVRAQHWDSRLAAIERIRRTYGDADLGRKVAEFTVLGPEPFSILAYHNIFFRQVRAAFVIGSYYPALTACCALGERILNHLLRNLRDDFRSSPEYRAVYRKDSFDDWEKAIGVLESWGVLLPDVCAKFRELHKKRNAAIHFRPEIDGDARELALEVIGLLGEIIDGQFGAFGAQPWYMENTPGETYVKKSYEEMPFVRRVVLPYALHVGPRHTLRFDESVGRFVIEDIGDAGPEEGSDAEFLELHTGAASE